jgi:hypothetical protein
VRASKGCGDAKTVRAFTPLLLTLPGPRDRSAVRAARGLLWLAPVTSRHRRIDSGFARVPFRTPGAVAAAVALAMSASGCLSHEYRLSQAELVRMAALPPQTRGDHVRVVQELGTRRGGAISADAPAPQAAVVDHDVLVDVHLDGGGTGSNGDSGAASRGPRPGGGRVSGHPVAARGPGVAAPTSHESGGGGGGFGQISSGGGGGNGDELVVLAVVVVAIAILAAVGLAVTEGLRYDGEIAVAPGQILYLATAAEVLQIAVADLTPEQAARAHGALLRDDEGWGLYRWGRAPLDRRGAAFKVDFGGFAVLDHYDVAGFASHVQIGGFPCQWLGLLGSWAITAAEDAQGNLFARHNFALEAQLFPVRLGPLSAGVFGHAGPSLATKPGGGTETSLAAGGGALLELALTTRLALTFRADWTGTRTTPDHWSPSTTLSGGLAIY